MAADSVITSELLPPPPPPPPPPNPIINNTKITTRSQPNLSDCHACNRRFNSTDPADRLRLVPSLWRIVLLCKPCLRLLHSSILCSYCFSNIISNSDSDQFHRCRTCNRSIHANCVENYSNCPPWSYSVGPTGGGFGGVCVDCWIPRGLEREFGGRIRVRRKRKLRNHCEGKLEFNDCESKLDDFERKLSDCEGNDDDVRVLEEAEREARKKVLVAEEAKGKALMKAVAASRAVELASEALELVVKKRGGKSGCAGEKVGNGAVVDDDVQLAIQLHRAMNSSPRITRNLNLSVTKVSNCNGVSVLGKNGNVSVGVDGLESDGVVKTSSSSKSVNIGGGDDCVMDAESGSWVEEQKVCLGETEQRGPEKTNASSLGGDDSRFLRKYSRKGSCGFKMTGGEMGCRLSVPHLKCSDQSRAVGDAS